MFMIIFLIFYNLQVEYIFFSLAFNRDWIILCSCWKMISNDFQVIIFLHLNGIGINEITHLCL